MSPTFSICIPNYNYGRYLGETLESVLAQTYADFEVVVVDNASTDDSVEVVQRFADPRVRLVRNRCNVGFALNVQRATALARGDFVNVLSSDDRMHPDALASYAEALRSQGERASNTVLCSAVEVIDSQGRVTGALGRAAGSYEPVRLDPRVARTGAPPLRVDRGREVLAATLSRLRTFAPFLTITYPRPLWDRLEGYTGARTVGPDKHFNFRLLALDPDVVYLPRALFQYRVHGSANAVAIVTTLRSQIDDYLYTLEYGPAELAGLGIPPRGLAREFVDRICLRAGLGAALRGWVAQAFRLFAFALATYPGQACRSPRAYALGGLLLLGPLLPLLAPLWRRWLASRREAIAPVLGAGDGPGGGDR